MRLTQLKMNHTQVDYWHSIQCVSYTLGIRVFWCFLPGFPMSKRWFQVDPNSSEKVRNYLLNVHRIHFPAQSRTNKITLRDLFSNRAFWSMQRVKPWLEQLSLNLWGIFWTWTCRLARHIRWIYRIDWQSMDAQEGTLLGQSFFLLSTVKNTF